MGLRWLIALAVGLCICRPLLLCGSAAARWQPTPTTAPWQWQLQGKIDTGVAAPVYDIDGFETPATVVQRLHRTGRHVVCYLDVGSWESYRPDAGSFPRSVIGRRYEGFPDERWLDIRRFHRFAKPLQRRFDICARKGFDAVEPDNVAGWENKTGFPIGAAAQLRFNRWVARQVHARGMAIALKNDPRQVKPAARRLRLRDRRAVLPVRRMRPLRALRESGKAVFEAEYELEPSDYCAAAAALDFSAIRKSYDLFAQPWRPCPS